MGRPAQDALEATVVLEAWGGLAGVSRFELGLAVVETAPLLPPPVRAKDTVLRDGAPSAPTDGVGLVFALLAIAIWMIPLTDKLGSVVVTRAWATALPVTMAMQWLLSRRYLAGPDGLGRLRNGCHTVVVLLAAAMVASALTSRGSALLAAGLVFIWVSGLVLIRRRWGVLYATMIGAATVALLLGLPPLADVSLLVVMTGSGLVIALRSQTSTRAPTTWRRAVPAGLIGAGMGTLIVLSAGGTSNGAVTVLVLLPSLAGSVWAGHHLSQLWRVVPPALLTRSVGRRSRSDLLRLAGPVLLGALVRAILATSALSLVLVLGVAFRDRGEDLGPALGALAGIGIVGIVVSALEAFRRPGWAMAVVSSGIASNLLTIDHGFGAGAGSVLVVPTLVALLVAVWPLADLLADVDLALARSGI